MKKFKYNNYEILIDDFETSKCFNETKIIKNQEYRKFNKYVDEKMTDEEKAVFAALCIDLKKLNIKYAFYSKQKDWNTIIRTSIIGEFISYPQSSYKTIEDVMENGFDVLDDVEDNDITVGHFKIHIFTPDECYSESYNNENSIGIDIYVNGLPWLLDEKCNHKAPKSPSKFKVYLIEHHPKLAMQFMKFRCFIPNLFRKNKIRNEHKNSLSNEFEKLKKHFGIHYTVLNNDEILEYKKQWVRAFLPIDADEKLKKKAYDLCVENKEFNTFLWHIFSFEIIESEENPTEKFDSINKNKCTLLFETNSENVAIKMTSAEKICESDIVEFCKSIAGWSDFVITADDFSWTYSRTHEDGWCGPYFYQK